MSKTVLMVCTSHTKVSENHSTGVWMEEFAVPYQRFIEEGYRVITASIRGGVVEHDPQSAPTEKQSSLWKEAIGELQSTVSLSDISVSEIDGIFLPGGHGTMFDFPHSEQLQNILMECVLNNKVIASVCHGPAALVNVLLPDGTPFVAGKKMACFTDAEEISLNLHEVMPFLLESNLLELGASVEKGDPWSEKVVVDGNLLTGQNPMSTKALSEKFVTTLGTTGGCGTPFGCNQCGK